MSSPTIGQFHRATRTGLAVILVLILAAIPGACRPRQQVEGEAAPEFVLPDLAGNQVSLSSLRGRPIVLTFWGTT